MITISSFTTPTKNAFKAIKTLFTSYQYTVNYWKPNQSKYHTRVSPSLSNTLQATKNIQLHRITIIYSCHSNYQENIFFFKPFSFIVLCFILCFWFEENNLLKPHIAFVTDYCYLHIHPWNNFKLIDCDRNDHSNKYRVTAIWRDF